MTFNVLHESMRNFAAPWVIRRPIVAKTIRSIQPDIACLQEVSARQLGDLSLDLAEYDFIEGTPSGATTLPHWASGMAPAARWVLGDFYDAGELCPILLRRGSLSAARHGSFLLHPEQAGNFSGGSRTPHIVNWARVEESGRPACFVYNTHLGLVPWTARRTARELMERLDQDWNHEPQILAGDFNSTPAGAVVRSLLAGRNAGPPAFHDAWIEARRQGGTGRTFHWGFGLPGPRLDYILVRPLCPVLTASTSAVKTGGVFASDHAAFTAELELPTRAVD
jgi:endonuclease/exonuclease/phosphatase family metal-dependent hydrolase